MADNLEEAQEFLERLEQDFYFDELNLESYSTVKNALEDIFKASQHAPPTARQIQAVYNAGNASRVQFPQAGINRIQYSRGNTIVTRYNIPGRRGLFNFRSALAASRGEL